MQVIWAVSILLAAVFVLMPLVVWALRTLRRAWTDLRDVLWTLKRWTRMGMKIDQLTPEQKAAVWLFVESQLRSSAAEGRTSTAAASSRTIRH